MTRAESLTMRVKRDTQELLKQIEEQARALEELREQVKLAEASETAPEDQKDDYGFKALLEYKVAEVDDLARASGKSRSEVYDLLFDELASDGRAVSLIGLGQPKAWTWRYDPATGAEGMFRWVMAVLEGVAPRQVTFDDFKSLTGDDGVKVHTALNKAEYNNLITVHKLTARKNAYRFLAKPTQVVKVDNALRAARRRRASVSPAKETRRRK